jgi:HAD superfamily hydrolase (TIGR01509 family)
MNVAEAFFFDLDGTLVDTYKADFLAYHDAIKLVTGKDIEQAAYNALHGKEIKQKLANLLPKLSDEEVAAIVKQKRERYPEYLHFTKPNEPLIALLKQLSKHYPTVLVTTAKRANVDAVLPVYNLAPYFSHMVVGDEVQNTKPHPEPYLLALQKTGLKPDLVLAFEDSQSGIDSAIGAGIKVIHIKDFA